MEPRLTLDKERLARFCERWKIRELDLFGSVLRDDFGPNSDVDLLVTFRPDADWSLFDHVEMEDELSLLVGRNVDLVSKRAIEHSRNPLRRKWILESAVPYYVAG